ncbi:MAG: SDR family NAD(P)-dependent oxidoreductase [Chloroflexi bacterium]|nr:SDR family NAD(P)-dependent oxidoreductase [Chloroflexota bacterium]
MSLPSTSDESRTQAVEPIAIIGIGCRFPGGVNSPESFWNALVNGLDAIAEIPASRFDVDAFYDSKPATPGKMMTRWGGFLDDIDKFDALFFGISPREADRMDPQQRLLLETAWEALEDAGQAPDKLVGSQTGVFVGLWLNDYEARMFNDPALVDFYMTTGSGRYSASGRLSYAFGFQGPSFTLDCACASSLVAVHLACQSLRTGECSLALAGGANVILQPHITIAYSQSKMMAPDGRCKFGDARADGYVRSEGAGVVALKRLSQAIADGDPIYAVIRGSAVNNDGRTSGFLATPGQEGQEEMLVKAYRHAGVDPSRVHYLEAHGTGTAAGDPVELGALGAVLGKGRSPDQPCIVGSVKTNFGHTEGAAGVAGLIKVALSLKHKQLPATLHLQTPNPNIAWDDLKLTVKPTLTPWPADSGPPTAGVSSFGIAGTNAHVVLQEASETPSVLRSTPKRSGEGGTLGVSEDGVYLLPLSAHTPEALQALARAYRDLLFTDNCSLHDICYTASVRRAHHEHRLAVVGRSGDELVRQLDAFLNDQPSAGLSAGRKSAERQPGVVFVFPGQGSQWFGMGRGLLTSEPVFRETLERCDQAFRPFVDWSLLEQLTANPEQSRLNEIDVIQPALFAIEVALAALWRSWGIEPDAVVGHSMGEVAAAHVAGALTLEDAARVICQRSKLLKRVAGQGAMAVVGLSLVQAQEAVLGYEDKLSIAVSNSPKSTVLSGDPAALEAVLGALRAGNVFCRPVKVDVASHSPQMESLRADLLAALDGLQPRAASTPIDSTVIDATTDGSTFDANYWAKNLRQPVLFSNAVQRLAKAGHTVFIEMSPHPILLPSVDETLHHLNQTGHTVPSLQREADESAAMLGALGVMYTLGYMPDWRKRFPNGGRHVRLPAYPWQRRHFWLEAGAATSTTRPAWALAGAGDPLLGHRLPGLAHLPGSHFWQNKLDGRFRKYLRAHQLEVTASSLYVEMALTAAKTVFEGRVCTVKQVVIHQPLPEDGESESQMILTRDDDNAASFQIFSRVGEADSWKCCVSGNIGVWPFEADWLYDLTWQAKPRASMQKRVDAPGRWLILADEGGLGAALAKLLEAKGETCALALADETNIEDLLTKPHRGVIYLRGLEATLDSVTASCESALRLMQALPRNEGARPRLWLVTRGAQPVKPESLALAQAPLWGLGRVMALEHPESWGGLVDLPSVTTTAEDAVTLLDEIWESDGEDQIAFRDGERYVARLERSREKPVEARPLTLRPDATYLISGGLGGVGLQVARWLAVNGAQHLLLTGRTGLPERSEWKTVSPDSKFGKQIAAVQALEEQGATVTVAKADVADLAQMTELFRRTTPPVRGVIHAAGLTTNKPLKELDADSFQAILHPKVSGAWALHQLTQKMALDFFVMFSSGASVWGSQGLAHYAAANHFLDALAHHRRASGLPALAVNWGWWAGDGLATDDLARLFTQVGLSAMPPEKAAAAMGYLLETGATQQVVAAVDWGIFRPVYEARRTRPLLEHPAALTKTMTEPSAKAPDGFARRLQEAAPHERSEILFGYVREQVARVLGFTTPESLDARQGFFKIGMDSMMAVQLRTRLEVALGCSLPPTVALEYPTVETMTHYLAKDVLKLAAPEPAKPRPELAAASDAQEKAKLDMLSEDELITMLDDELGAIDDLIKDGR